MESNMGNKKAHQPDELLINYWNSIRTSKFGRSLGYLNEVTLTTHVDEDSINNPLTHFTHWQKRSASRIDRIYLSSDIAHTAQWIEAREPVHYSGHQELRLWLTLSQQQRTESPKRARYPFNSARPEWVQNQIRKRLNKLKTEFQKQTCPAKAWDTFVKQMSAMVKEVARVDKEHMGHYYKRRQNNLRNHATTAKELQRLADSTTTGSYYPDNMTTAEDMACERNNILGASHAMVHPDNIREALRKFQEVPIEHKLQPEDQRNLIKPITEQEILYAIDPLPQAALDEYGPQEFLDVFQSMHNGTVASYLVNGEESAKWEIKSGIRQGCPLAPLLFVLAVDFLGRGIENDPEIKGLEIPGSGGVRQKFNGFVDDSTPGVGKSPILGNTDTIRVLDYYFGLVNWEIHLQNFKRLLQVTTTVTNSVKQRVILFNTVVISGYFHWSTLPHIKAAVKKCLQKKIKEA
ncbi:hypothetical protein ON010_g3778 [Phytophthora cinnamomi]|nr:hypothetical protein ON010_g3778 [Phytophthora cinnamomi]